ncbi:MAG TPA: hypothetical protein VH417_20490 [Vicinamibacterales bacterium]
MPRPCFRVVLIVCPVLLVALRGAATAQEIAAAPHVRTDEPRLRALIARGAVQSPTFRAIVVHIDQLPALVYVVASQCGTRATLSACLDHGVQTRGGYRFVRINMLPGEPEYRQLPLLAHELQHALEVLSDESAASPETVAKLYERIGVRQPGVGNFETDAARRVQETVCRELRAYGR